MQRAKYFADTAPGECQLNFHVDSDVESIQRRFLGTGTPGVQAGLIVVPNLSSLPPKINVGPGTGFTPSGERINVAALISGQALASTAVGDENYVSLVYAEIEDTPLQERYAPVQHDTLVHESYTVEVLVAADWATAEREVRLLLAIVTAQGPATYLTSADIENAVLPGSGVFSSQPVYITGVLVTGIDQTTPSGIGTMSFSPLASPPLMTWLAPGDTGTPTSVPITGFGAFTLPSPNGKTIRIYVTYSSLPLIVATDYLSVNQLYSPDIPILTARDESHRAMIGTGYPTVQNPHGTSLADLGVSEVGLVKEHQDLMHSNGIYRESAAGVLAATPGAAGSGTPPFTNDYLILTQPSTGVDCYWINGKKLVAVSQTISFDDALTQLYLYETYVSDLGAAAKYPRATTPATRKVTGVRIIAMGEEVIAGTYDLWYSRTGDSLSIRWNNGPIQTFTVYPAIPGRTWRVLEGEDGGRVTVFIDDDKLPASGTSDTDVWTVIDPLDRTTCLILQQVAFDGEENVAGEQIRSDFITDLRVFGTLGPDAGADTLDRQYEENMWAQRKYSDGVLWGLDITNASAVVSWEYGEALVGGKKYRLANGVTPNLTPLGNGSWYVYVGEDGTVQWSLTNPSVLVSDRYPTKRLPYALLATVVVSGGAYVSITISRKAPDFVVGNIYQQGTSRYMRDTNQYPHTCGCGLWRDGVDGTQYVIREVRDPDWNLYYDRFGITRVGAAYACSHVAGYGFTGYGICAGGGGLQGIGYGVGVMGCQCGCNTGVGVCGYARNTLGNASGYGVIGYAPFAGGVGVFGCGANTGVCGYSATGYGVLGGSTDYYGVYGYSSNCWAGVFCGKTGGVLGNASGVNGIGVYGCATGNGSTGVCGYGDITGVVGYGAGTGSTGVLGCGTLYGGRFCSYGANGCAVFGHATSGVGGYFQTDTADYGVIGVALLAGGEGIYGCGSARGVRGKSLANGSYGGIFCADGTGSVGAYGCTASSTGIGVSGEAAGNGTGVCGYSAGGGVGGSFCAVTGWGVYAYGVHGVHGCSNTGAGYGVLGCSGSSGIGVYGCNSGAGVGSSGYSLTGKGVCGVSGGADAGVYGYSTTGPGVIGCGVNGVQGKAPGGGTGTYGCSQTGYGVEGYSAGAVSGVYGNSVGAMGVYGITNADSFGVRGEGVANAGGEGVYGCGAARGVRGCSTGNGSMGGTFCGCNSQTGTYGVYGEGNAYGGYFYAPGTGSCGVYGAAPSGLGGCFVGGVSGVVGCSTGGNYGVAGFSSATGGIGVYGFSTDGAGICGHSCSGVGVRGDSFSGCAGYFDGNVMMVNGCYGANGTWANYDSFTFSNGLATLHVCRGIIVCTT